MESYTDYFNYIFNNPLTNTPIKRFIFGSVSVIVLFNIIKPSYFFDENGNAYPSKFSVSPPVDPASKQVSYDELPKLSFVHAGFLTGLVLSGL